MIKLKSCLPENSLLQEKVVYHGTISDFVDIIQKSGKLKSVLAGANKVSGGLTTEKGFIWVTPDFDIANLYADGMEASMVKTAKGLKAEYGGVFELTIDDNMKLIDRHAPLNQKQIDFLNYKFIPHYKPLKLGDSLANAEWRANTQLHEMVKALGFDGVTYSKGKQIGIVADELPITVLHKKPFKKP